jgi:selenocysteine-specific elongation factor
MIIGTAGHIDHGKTTLVRALTGVDTDRLPEEKRRGISIELGYAYLHAPDGVSLGFVDVPGHERLLHTMLAGATGIDHALLVVAADDGVMSQTREHLAVVALLGVRDATVAITKADRVDAARIAEVRAEVAALLAPTPFADAPMLAVSATTGEGIETLRARLLDVAREEWTREDGLAFRLAVDRAFTLSGVGTVVTGTVFSGTVRIGDELRLGPGERSVRVRGIHAQNQQAESAHAGQRCALALAGVTKDEAHRGDWVCTPAIALATDRIDVLLTLWPDEAKAARAGPPPRQGAALGRDGACAPRRERRDGLGRAARPRRARARRNGARPAGAAREGRRLARRPRRAARCLGHAHRGRRARARPLRAGALPAHA